MRTRRRTEITVETHRVLAIGSRGALREGWCARCARRVATIRLEEAPAAVSLHATSRRGDAGGPHLAANAGGSSFICLNSLIE